MINYKLPYNPNEPPATNAILNRFHIKGARRSKGQIILKTNDCTLRIHVSICSRLHRINLIVIPRELDMAVINIFSICLFPDVNNLLEYEIENMISTISYLGKISTDDIYFDTTGYTYEK